MPFDGEAFLTSAMTERPWPRMALAKLLGAGGRRKGLLRQLLLRSDCSPRLDAPGLFRDDAVENRAGCDRIREKISDAVVMLNIHFLHSFRDS